MLNKRFVSFYYNTFQGTGHDQDAADFAETLVSQDASPTRGRGNVGLKYGAFVTPDGKLIDSFGYDMKEVYSAVKSALRKHPAQNWMTDDEKAIVAAAKASPNKASAQIKAAELYASLLEFEKAAEHLNRAITHGSPELQAKAKYLKAHHVVIDIGNEDKSKARAALTKVLPNLPTDLQDDAVTDLVALDTRVRPSGAFYTGWELQPGADAAKIEKTLEKWIKKAPDSNRIGQMHFLLGVARNSQGRIDDAEQAWIDGSTKYPDDVYALVSRLEHRSYKFSPNRANRPQIGGTRGSSVDQKAIQVLRKYATGGQIAITYKDGRMYVNDKLVSKEDEVVLRKILPPPGSGGG